MNWKFNTSNTLVALALGAVFLSTPLSAQTALDVYRQAEEIRNNATTDEELFRAIELYRESAELGKGAAHYRIGTLMLRLGRGEEALEALEAAVELGVGSAVVALAKGHAQGAFGDKSDPARGAPVLEEVAQSDSRTGQSAAYALAELYEIGQGVPKDSSRAAEIYSELAEVENPRALRKVGRSYLRGDRRKDVAPDLEKAIEFLQRGVDAGSNSARRDLGNALVSVGRYEEGIEVLQTAADQNIRGAAAELANLHYLEELGTFSDRQKGRAELKRLAEAGDPYAMRYALINHERKSRRINDLDLAGVLDTLEAQTDAGSRFAARMLARAYRKLYFLIPNYRDRLKTLVDEHGDTLGVDALAAERVSVIYDKNDHATSREKVLDLLEEEQGKAYVSAALRLRSIEPQAFMHLMQRELKEAGVYNGRVNGLATLSTLRAILRYCEAEGFYDTCKHAPVGYFSSALVLEALDRNR